MPTHGGERVRGGGGRGSGDHRGDGEKGLEARGSLSLSVDGEREVFSLLLGFSTFPIKHSLLRV